MQKTLGGDRLGSGSKMKVELRNYERSTHDLSYVWRSTMAAGTLVPFLTEVALPGDTFDINLGCEIMTHPTVGPLFGSYKVQLDVFQAPIRLYNGLLHNNALGIGMNMSGVLLPKIELTASVRAAKPVSEDNSQINPSCILSYLGIRGVGTVTGGTPQKRKFNATPLLAYWEIYKNYYANKQEEIGAVLHTPSGAINQTVTKVEIKNLPVTSSPVMLAQVPAAPSNIPVTTGTQFIVTFSGATPLTDTIMIRLTKQGERSLKSLCSSFTTTGTTITGNYNGAVAPDNALNWAYKTAQTGSQGKPSISTFPLNNIDLMRNAILSKNTPGDEVVVTNASYSPYGWLPEITNGVPNCLSGQEGLGLKTYQSDLFNNWLSTDWIDGVGGISEITSIDTSGGSFTIDTLNLSKKVYDMLNRIAVSGGSYDDWLNAVYAHEPFTRAESPIYCGGLIKELVFQEVIANTAADGQPLGQLGGRGTMSPKHKGGSITIKVDEPSYIIGIISLTPRVDYSQGNKWDVNLNSLNDLHKPQLDEIGFQELITEQMAWWDTHWANLGAGVYGWLQKSAGKQPAWINYMTRVNETRGNFAIDFSNAQGDETGSEMFMTLNRRYEPDPSLNIKDLTTYIDPSKFNHIFAETALDAQNFWTQIAINMTARRKMSAKLMPNL